MRAVRRRIASGLPAVLVAGLLGVVTLPGAAQAGEPSVALPTVPSTPVTEQKVDTPRDQDQASADALHGDQTGDTATPAGGGTSKATPLSPSATWDVAAQSGDFSWSYPLRVPPAPGGLAPDLALSYASSAVDGRTSATNNQASWVGDGWDLSVGFIERSYGGCADDDMGGTTPPQTVGDLCWRSDNAVAFYGGGGGMLVRDDTTGAWRAKSDDGSLIERLTGGANGDNDGESWRITTVDGTRYLFGSRPEANSTWTVPVFGDDAGEPCHQSTFDASHCVQAWRWNLDKVIDRHGNVIVYNYATETNSYGLGGKDTAVPYVRGGTLKSAEYGLRDGSSQPATARVDFEPASRCVPGSECVATKPKNWPDVAWDDKCDTATCVNHPSPTFWSTQRLSKITTRVRTGSGYRDVESWSLDQQFPDPGDGEKAALWLKGITHTGLAGDQPITLPAVTFEGTKMPNRVVKVDGVGPLNRYRITGVVSESGGVLTVAYAKPNCVDGSSMPAKPETNTLRCFPMTWAKPDYAKRTDYFHKYVVAQVTESDRISANTEHVTSYEYLDGAAWGYDTSEFTKPADRTWNEYHGFAKVRIRTGKPDDPSGPVTMTEQRFYRGMDGDKLPTGTRPASVTDSQGVIRRDDPWLRGVLLESQTHDGESDRVVSKTINTPTWQGPTASRGSLKAYIVRDGVTADYTALASGGWRTTRTERSYDDRGLPTQVNDLGDTSTAADDKCTRTTYLRNTGRWLLNAASRVETVSVACAATPTFPANAVADTRYAYDGKGFGVAPTVGDVTRTEVLDQRPASGPVYTLESTASYDALGRVTSSGTPGPTADAPNRVTTTRYVPETGGPVTQTVVTDPATFTTTTTVEPAFGQPTLVVDANGRRTETAYDALGRTVEVWLPNRKRAAGEGGNYKYAYDYHNDKPTVTTTSKINAKGNYVTGKQLYDGLLRLRQTQAPAPGGGRLITDTRYDSQGRVYKTTQPYFVDSPMDDSLWIAADVSVAALTTMEFDGAGRKVEEIVKGGGEKKWQTSTRYDGDRVHVTPPAGGTATTTISDARGQVTELWQYHGPTPTGTHDTTTYTYTPAGQLATVTDPAGNRWRQTYDLHGRQTKDEDPDKGTSTKAYDLAGQLAHSTDARNVSLFYDYDDLGRQTAIRQGSATGAKLAEWTYDTALFGKGLPATATRYVGGAAYTSSTVGYNALNQPLAKKITIPEVEQTLADTYEIDAKYNPDGSLSAETYPQIGGLGTETVLHTYDDLGQPETTSGGLGGNTTNYVTSTQYTRYGELERTQLGDKEKRVWLSNYYDTNTRRVEHSIVDAEVPRPMQSDVHYTYDPAGNMTSVADTAQDQPADVQCFRYDYLRRLTEAWTPGAGCASEPSVAALTGPAPYWQSFTYDAVGNRRTETQHGATGDTVRTSSYPAAGAEHGHSLSEVATKSPAGVTTTASYGYDASGNTTTRTSSTGTQRLDWDAEGHLAKVTEDGKTTEFVYDADGGRLIRRDPTGSTLYLDGQELRLTKATGALTATRYYQHGDATVAMRDDSGLTWLAADHQGTAQLAVNSATMQVTRRRQTPFGEARGQAVAFPGEKGFVGGTVDSSTGLTHLGAREYDPALGRFISVDPVMDLSDPQQMHGYTYANNNPVTHADPGGQFWGELWSGVKNTFNKVNNWVADFPGNVGKAVNNFLDNTKFGRWIDRNKGWIGAVAGTIGFVAGAALAVAFSPVTLAVAATATVISTGMTVWDMAQLSNTPPAERDTRNRVSFGLDALSLALGPVGAAAKGAGELVAGYFGVANDVGGAIYGDTDTPESGDTDWRTGLPMDCRDFDSGSPIPCVSRPYIPPVKRMCLWSTTGCASKNFRPQKPGFFEKLAERSYRRSYEYHTPPRPPSRPNRPADSTGHYTTPDGKFCNTHGGPCAV